MEHLVANHGEEVDSARGHLAEEGEHKKINGDELVPPESPALVTQSSPRDASTFV